MNRVYPGLGTDDSFQLFVSGIAISTDLVNWEDALGHPIGETGGVDEATVSFHSVGSTRYVVQQDRDGEVRSEEHTSELQSLMRISYAVFCLKKKTNNIIPT